MKSAVMLSGIMLNVVTLNVIIQSVMSIFLVTSKGNNIEATQNFRN
jgi:hypothetical protein